MRRPHKYDIDLYPEKALTKVDFHGIQFGYSGNPVLIKEGTRTLMVKELGGKAWAGLGTSKYYSPRIRILIRVGTEEIIEPKAEWQRQKRRMHVVQVWEKDYTRQTRKEAYQEAEIIIKQYEDMSADDIQKIISEAW